MIIVPIRRNPKYRRVIRKNVEVIGADFEVDTVVSFCERTIEEYTVKCVLVGIHSHDTPVIESKYKYEPEVKYIFRTPVYLSGKEYENNRHSIEEYVCNKAKMSSKYRQGLQECFSKVSNGREYEIETFLENSPECRKVHFSTTEYEEYVPIQ